MFRLNSLIFFILFLVSPYLVYGFCLKPGERHWTEGTGPISSIRVWRALKAYGLDTRNPYHLRAALCNGSSREDIAYVDISISELGHGLYRAGLRPLHYTALKVLIEPLKVLLAAGAEVNSKDDISGLSPGIRDYVLRRWARDGHGRTALSHAVFDYFEAGTSQGGCTNCNEAWRIPTIKVLLEAGADPNIPDSVGKTSLDYARQFNFKEIEKLLLAASQSQSSTSGQSEVATQSAHPNIDELNNKGFTKLMLAVRRGQTDRVRELLAAGASTDIQDTRHKNTALIWASWKNRLEIARLLIEAGADISIKNKRGRDALWHANRRRHTNIASLLRNSKPQATPEPQAINGACNNAVQNGCQTGLANDNAIADTSAYYRWYCLGQHGGTSATNCQKLKTINGQCDNNRRNGCRAGSATSVSTSGDYYVWYCAGQHGGSRSGQCRKARPVNGLCDNNRRHRCHNGRATSTSTSGNYYVWYCTGQNGGSRSGQCRKARPVNGLCDNNRRHRCHNGRATSTSTSGNYYVWYCTGQNGGSRSGRCSKAIPTPELQAINGACNNAVQNGCQTGLLKDVGDTDGYYRWQCVGQHGGTTATNCKKLRPINGACNNAIRNSCQTGVLEDVRDTFVYYRWACIGQHGGTTATNCQKYKPLNGACNNAVQNGCRVGRAKDNAIADTYLRYRWHCVGMHGGTTATNCQKSRTINGQCNNARRNGCRAGLANDNAIADTSAYYRWYCLGQRGGTTATNCQKAIK